MAVKKFRNLMLVMMGAVLLVACATSAEAERKTWVPPKEIPIYEFPVGRNWRRTFDFLPTFEQDKAVFSTWQNLIGNCMSSHGLQYEKVRFYGDIWADSFNPLDKNLASNFGYHDPSRTEMNQHVGDMSPQNQATFENCSKLAATKTYQVIEPQTKRLQAVLNGLLEHYSDEGNAAIEKSMDKWVSCMSESGIRARSQDELSLRFSRNKEISNDEIQTRMIDVMCDETAGVTKARSLAEGAAIKDWMEENSSDLAEMRNLYREISRKIELMGRP